MDIFMTKRKIPKEKRYEYRPMYKGEMMCHFKLVNKVSQEVVYQYLTDRTPFTQPPQKERGTFHNNSQNYTWDKQAQNAIVVNNDVFRICDLEKESVIQLTVLEITKQSAKNGGGEVFKPVLHCQHDLHSDPALIEKLKAGTLCQHTIEFDCRSNSEIKLLTCALNLFYDIYAPEKGTWNIDE